MRAAPNAARPAPGRWTLVLGSMASLAVVYIGWSTFGLLVVALGEEFGWTRAGVAFAYSVSVFVHGLAAPFAGGLVDRLGPRRVIVSGALLVMLSLAAASRIDSLWQLYLTYAVIGLGLTSAGSIAHFTVIQRWYVQGRGAALGLASVGLGLGQIILVPLTQYLIILLGWRPTLLILATLPLLIVVPITLLVQRLPEDGVTGRRGPRSLAKPEPDPLVVDPTWASQSWTLSTAARTNRFWLLFLGVLFGLLANQTVLVHQTAAIVGLGYEKMFAAAMFGLIGITGSTGRFLWGIVSDRLGREVTYAVAALILIMGVASLALAADTTAPWQIYLFAMLFGLGYGASSPLLPSMTADIFGGRSFGAIYGFLYVGYGVGAGFGPWFAGYLFDVTGSYRPALAMIAIAIILSTLAFWLAAPRKVRRVTGRLPAR